MLYYEYGSTSEKRRTDEVLDRWSHKQINDRHSDHTESAPAGHWAGGGRGVVLEAGGGGVGVALPPPPSPASFTWEQDVKEIWPIHCMICPTDLFVIIVDMVAGFEIAPSEIMILNTWVISQTETTHLSSATSFPAESDGFNKAPVRFRSSNIVRTTDGIKFKFVQQQKSTTTSPWWVLWSARSSSIMGVSRGPRGEVIAVTNHIH